MAEQKNEVVLSGEYEREVTTLEPGTASEIARSEIDTQIATAHRYPRSVTRFREQVSALATLNEQVAGECTYALPRDGKVIEGPSARFAEIVASAWGNMRTSARVVSDDGRFIVTQAICHDLENNNVIGFEVRRRITTKHGRRYSDDMIAVTGNAAASIAMRNAILKVVPKAFWADLHEQSRKCAKGSHKTLANRRAEAVKAFQGYGVSQEKLCEFVGVEGINDITQEHLATLRGIIVSFKEGETAPEQVFPETNGNTTPRSLDDFAAAQHPESVSDEATEATPDHSPGQAQPASDDLPSASEAGASGEDHDYQAGMSAGLQGKTRRSMPAEVRDDEARADAWRRGLEAGLKARGQTTESEEAEV